tara:strand:- start:106 stop:303 length:198 start_codon:yes stop_codon:yes gene_type:complete
MKFFQIILIFLLGGCNYKEGVDYIGASPFYAINKPHASGCGCCNVLVPSELQQKFNQIKKDKEKS